MTSVKLDLEAMKRDKFTSKEGKFWNLKRVKQTYKNRKGSFTQISPSAGEREVTFSGFYQGKKSQIAVFTPRNDANRRTVEIPVKKMEEKLMDGEAFLLQFGNYFLIEGETGTPAPTATLDKENYKDVKEFGMWS